MNKRMNALAEKVSNEGALPVEQAVEKLLSLQSAKFVESV